MLTTGVPLSPPEILRMQVPLGLELTEWLREYRKDLGHTLKGRGWILIVGPCGLHHVSAALEYADRLVALKEHLPPDWRVLMRCCFEKSRSGLGWKGLLHGGEARSSIQCGLEQTRFVLKEVLARGLGTAAELLSPLALPYLEDLLCYGWIGARTGLSQAHRELASAACFPVGFKNGVEGDLQGAIDGALVSSSPHSLLTIGSKGLAQESITLGNPTPHVILRGGIKGPNVHSSVVETVASLMAQHSLCSRVMVDCSHGNSGKRPELQGGILQRALGLGDSVAGVLIESYLEGGSRPDRGANSDPLYSITDPCLGWEETKIMLLEAADRYAGMSIQRNHNW